MGAKEDENRKGQMGTLRSSQGDGFVRGRVKSDLSNKGHERS